MDDRLWWFANKIQDVYQIGTYDSPTLLEDFISADATVEAINGFLSEYFLKMYKWVHICKVNTLKPFITVGNLFM